jgi:hypothetical protein
MVAMSTRNLPTGKGQPARKADNLTAICEPIVQKMWEPWRLTTLWAWRQVTGIVLRFTFYVWGVCMPGARDRMVLLVLPLHERGEEVCLPWG